jgi:glycine/D-amino acid oxidase-like deaminating enzyme
VCEVLVIGFGVAGASAAIAAHDAGARVTVVEKTPAGGGNALYAGGFLLEAEVHDRLRALTVFSPRRRNVPRLPRQLIFDERARIAGPLNGIVGTPNDYVWSADDSAEIEAGWIVPIDELPTTYGSLPDEFGLFAAGGAGSVWGALTDHGGGLTDALVFGRIAGAEAAAYAA